MLLGNALLSDGRGLRLRGMVSSLPSVLPNAGEVGEGAQGRVWRGLDFVGQEVRYQSVVYLFVFVRYSSGRAD